MEETGPPVAFLDMFWQRVSLLITVNGEMDLQGSEMYWGESLLSHVSFRRETSSESSALQPISGKHGDSVYMPRRLCKTIPALVVVDFFSFTGFL